MRKSQVTNMNGQEMNFIWLGCRGRRVGQYSQFLCRSIVTAAERRREQGHGTLVVPQYLLGSKVAQYPRQACMHTYIYINMETSRKLYMLKSV